MKIVFANQKGGVGKSTLALLFAYYLVKIEKKKIFFIDMDFQKSVYTKYEQSLILSNSPLYEVESINIQDYDCVKKIVTNSDTIIIDLAGTLNNEGLIEIFEDADIIICPFAYDDLSSTSTLDFAYIIKRINQHVPIVFIPNRLRQTVKYETIEKVKNVLSHYGEVTEPITEKIDFQRINMFEIPEKIIEIIAPVFDLISKKFLTI